MRMLSRTVGCPLCGQPASLTLFEDIDLARGTEGHRIEFGCTDRRHELTEVDMLRLWAAARTDNPQQVPR